MLTSYGTRTRPAMRFMSDLGGMWGVAQQGIPELDFDFVAYASRALRPGTAAEAAFQEALEPG